MLKALYFFPELRDRRKISTTVTKRMVTLHPGQNKPNKGERIKGVFLYVPGEFRQNKVIPPFRKCLNGLRLKQGLALLFAGNAEVGWSVIE